MAGAPCPESANAKLQWRRIVCLLDRALVVERHYFYLPWISSEAAQA